MEACRSIMRAVGIKVLKNKLSDTCGSPRRARTCCRIAIGSWRGCARRPAAETVADALLAQAVREGLITPAALPPEAPPPAPPQA